MAEPLRLQDLPPKWARFCLGVERFAAQQLGHPLAGASCVLGCSGGADSTALLVLIALLQRQSGGTLLAVHLDHCLRQESGQDAAFVRGLCENRNIPLVLERQDVARLAHDMGAGLEEAGRTARYALLERVRQERSADVILVGHHLNDLAEDQLLRLARGSGWPALGGMAAWDPARRLLRPLLLTPKAMLEDFLTSLRQPWRTDATNAQPCATRNRVRQSILPAMLRENPAYLDAAARLWRQARVDREHWDAELRAAQGTGPKTDGGAGVLSAALLSASPAALRLRLYKQALDSLGPGQARCDALMRLDELWRAKASGKSLGFPGDKEARIGKAGIAFRVIDRKKECG